MKPRLKTVTVSIATSLWMSFAASAATLTFDFSFTNSANGGGTVMGVITGLLDNATSAATSVRVTSNTAGFGIGEYVGNPPSNVFTVSGGTITAPYIFESFGVLNTSPAVTCCSLAFNLTAGIIGAEPTAGLANDRGSVILGSGATFTPVVPIPATLPLFATGLAGLGLLGWRRKKAAAG